MRSSSILALFLFSACFSIQSEATNVDSEFTQLCPVANETTYHVNVALGCKVYYICEKGKFVDFRRCEGSRTFSHVSYHCELDIPCTSNRTLELLEIEKSEAISKRIPFNRVTIIRLIDSILSHINKTNQAQKVSNVVSTSPASTVSFISHADSGTATGISTFLTDSSSKSSPSSHARSVESESHLLSSHVPLPKKEHLQTTESSVPPNSKSTINVSEKTKTGPSGVRKDSTRIELDTTNETSTIYDQRRYNLLNKIIVPTVREIVNDPLRMTKVALLFRTVFEAVAPLANQFLQQSRDVLPGSTISISKQGYKDAVLKIRTQAYPMLKEFLLENLPVVLERAADNVPELLDYMDDVKKRIKPHSMGLLKNSIALMRKYKDVAKNSSAEYFNTYSLKEIQKDIEPMMTILYDVFQEDVYESFKVQIPNL